MELERSNFNKTASVIYVLQLADISTGSQVNEAVIIVSNLKCL